MQPQKVVCLCKKVRVKVVSDRLNVDWTWR